MKDNEILKKELIQELERIKPELQAPPDIENFKQHYREIIQKNEELENNLRLSQIIDGTILLKKLK